MTNDELMLIRQTSLAQIEHLAGLLQHPHLTDDQRRLLVSIRQARIIELGAIEQFLRIERTIQPKRRRRQPARMC